MNIGLGIFGVSTGLHLVWTSSRMAARGGRSGSGNILSKQVSTTARDVVGRLEKRVQMDEGKRGIGEITLQGELFSAASELLGAKRVVIITGFPCNMDYTPPTETDGPLGAIAIARALIELGKQVVIATDECNEEPVIAAVAASGLYGVNLQLECFAGGVGYDEGEAARLKALADSVDMVVAIERAGPCADGTYRTMRGLDMSHIVAPLELLLINGEDFEGADGEDHAATVTVPNKKIRSVAIGDGGNEVGMGKIYQSILKSSIPNAKDIACVVPSDHLIVASVSNWGGYALAAAMAVLSAGDSSDMLARCLVSSAQETEICSRLVEAGARDGISKKQELSIDGMTLGATLDVLEDLRRIAAAK